MIAASHSRPDRLWMPLRPVMPSVNCMHSLQCSEPACMTAHAYGESGNALQVQGETLQPPRPLPWYPDKLAWHMTFSREQLRSNPKLNEVMACLITSAASPHWLHDLVRQALRLAWHAYSWHISHRSNLHAQFWWCARTEQCSASGSPSLAPRCTVA